jgi:prepilin-type N-terminal cleavage/methylation domain-containing protein
MELIVGENVNKTRPKENGMSLIEMMIAMFVLLMGILGNMALMATAIGGNSRSKQQSNSTAIAQMVTEKIMSIPASTSTTLTITDCTNTANSLSTAPGGSPLLASGDADFTVAQVANYSMNYTDCGTQGRFIVYDVRWNIQSLTSYDKLLTVSARMQSTGTNARLFSLPMTIRTVVGQGT